MKDERGREMTYWGGLKSSAAGFGPTVKLLEVEPSRFMPWLTVELAEMEQQLLEGWDE